MHDKHGDGAALRGTLGHFATGVTVIAARDSDGDAFGMTANSFTSVSLDPPWILWNVAKDALCYERFIAAEHFLVQILASDQRDLAMHFATRAEDKFAAVDWRLGRHELPELPGVLARMYCRTTRLNEGGDHTTIIGEVEAHTVSAGRKPLLFYAGDFHELGPVRR